MEKVRKKYQHSKEFDTALNAHRDWWNKNAGKTFTRRDGWELTIFEGGKFRCKRYRETHLSEINFQTHKVVAGNDTYKCESKDRVFAGDIKFYVTSTGEPVLNGILFHH